MFQDFLKIQKGLLHDEKWFLNTTFTANSRLKSLTTLRSTSHRERIINAQIIDSVPYITMHVVLKAYSEK